ncbi:MAG: DUF4365 domain-containing protein [Burkholderiales bacterium]|nr:DUF4365 domain-containing protein [Burkholderiales bacterium]
MSKGFPSYSKAAQKGEQGVDLVSRVIHEEYGWLFKRNHQEHDFGIDAQIEVVLEDGTVTGQMFAVQIKYGKSFFSEKNQWGYVYRGELRHFNYLANYQAPVLITICHPDSKDIYWVAFDPNITSRAGENWKITIPFENIFSEAKSAISDLLPPPSDILDEVQHYWAINEALVATEYFHLIIDRTEVREFDFTSVRAFFDRIRSTKEIAAHCQGKVEISFHGYENDVRELYEISEMREFAPKLLEALPELFFFVYTGELAYTLKTLALCVADIEVKTRDPNGKNSFQLEISTEKIGKLLESHYLGLNEMVCWLNLPDEECERISKAVAKILLPDLIL